MRKNLQNRQRSTSPRQASAMSCPNLPAIASFFSLIPFLLGALLFTSGCASTPKESGGEPRNRNFPTADSIFKEGDVKNHPPTVYGCSIEQVRPAAVRALSFVGCKLEEQEDFFLKGKRPQKMGLFVGSGGETVKVFLYPKGTNQTDVWVDTDLSFVGIAGQQGWNKQVLAELSRILEQTQQPEQHAATK